MSVRRTRSKRSSPVRKNQKLELDRLSNLPNEITQQILSYLPIKEAGKTSILSHNWRFQWTMLPSLVINDHCNLEQLLLLHHGPIDSFKLSSNHMARSAVHRCIRHLSRHPIKMFILNYMRCRELYTVPSSLFFCQDLTHLELSDCNLRLPPWTFHGFRNLKTLDIQRAILLPQELGKLIASSPLLESLTLCDMKVPISRLKIDAPNLRFLKLLGDCEAVELTSTLNLVHVSIDRNRGMWDKILRSTPALQELEISSSPELKNSVSLDNEEASSWEFSKLQRLKVTNFSGAKSDVEFIKHLFLRSPALQELEVPVHKFSRQVDYSWSSHNDQNGSYSTQLRLVKLTSICGAQVEVEFIKFLLLSCHALEELHILFGENECETEYERETRRDQNCVFTQLRVIKIAGFSGAEAEVRLIKFLLTSSPMLQQITLQPASAKVSWEVSKLLNEFKGNSLQANVELLNPLNPSDDYYHSRAARSRSPDYRRRSRSPDYRRRYRSPSTDYDSDEWYYHIQ